MLQKAPSPGHGDAEEPTHLGVGARLLAHGVQVGDAAAEVEDAGPGQRQLHGVDVGLLGRGGCPLRGGEAAGCGRAGTQLGPPNIPPATPLPRARGRNTPGERQPKPPHVFRGNGPSGGTES